MKLVCYTVAAVLLITSGPSVFAQGSSNMAPGQKMQQTPQKEDKGASSFAPGQKMQQTPQNEDKGASSFAPGQTTGSGNMGDSKKKK
jgi:hypothetical protein